MDDGAPRTASSRPFGQSGVFMPALKTRAACLLTALAMAAPLLAPGAAHATDLAGYDSSASSADARFGAQIGAGAQWQSQSAPSGSGATTLGFGGGARLGCSGIDFNGFLHRFDPAELLAEIRNALLSGAQAAASSYLITLAYANPTLSSVLDMMDKKYTARFGAFAQACDAQAARARGLDRGARALAQAGDECFDAETARGTAPSEAYRRCSIARSFEGLDLPAVASTATFLRNYTQVNVTPEVEALLSLLPDERIEGGSYQMRPPQSTVAGMSQRLHDQARLALDRLDAGAAAGTVSSCGAAALLGTATGGDGCLPAAAQALVNSSAFGATRLLGPAARTLFKDALAAQIAIAAMYSNLLELFQQTARIDVRAGSDAAHADSRRRQMREALAELLQEADAQGKAQSARMEVVRLQMTALERVESDLEAAARRNREAARVTQFGMSRVMQMFAGAGAAAP